MGEKSYFNWFIFFLMIIITFGMVSFKKQLDREKAISKCILLASKNMFIATNLLVNKLVEEIQRSDSLAILYRAKYMIARSPVKKFNDFYVWDPKYERIYSSFRINKEKLDLVYRVGKREGLDLNKWMYFPKWESNFGNFRNPNYYYHPHHTYVKSHAGAVGLVQVMPSTARSYLEEMGYKNLGFEQISNLLYIDSINVECSVRYIRDFGLNYYVYVMGPHN